MSEKIRIAGISDTHFGITSPSATSKEEYREHILEMSENADLIVHCGDFTDRGDENGTKIAAEVFKESKIPVIGVLGNHDYQQNDSKRVRKILEEGGLTILNAEIVTFTKEHRSINFIGVTGFTSRDKEKIAKNSGITVDEYLKRVQHDFENFASKIQKVHGKENIALIHFQPVRKPKKDSNKKPHGAIRSNRYGDLFDENHKHIKLILHGHDHHKIDSPLFTKKGIPLHNIVIPTTMTPGIPYKIIEV